MLNGITESAILEGTVVLNGNIVDSTWFVPGIKFGERNFFWAWYQLKLICVLYFHFVPSPEKVSLAKFFPERWGGTNQVESTIEISKIFKRNFDQFISISKCAKCPQNTPGYWCVQG